MKTMRFYKFAQCVCRPFLKVLFRYYCDKRDTLPEKGNYIICSNHISFLDPLLIGLTQKRPVFFMAKAELFKNKLLGGIITALGAFPVQRGSDDGKAINTAEQLLKDGEAVGIFFEGTRSKTGELLRPRSGVSLIAYQTKTPVIPCCLTAEKGALKIFRKVKITYGEPMSVEELGLVNGSPAELRNATRKIMNVITEIRNKDIEEMKK